jgi:hypothetical protein
MRKSGSRTIGIRSLERAYKRRTSVAVFLCFEMAFWWVSLDYDRGADT